MNKPSNWYLLSYEERQDWERSQALEDLQDAKDQERQAREDAEAEAARLRRDAQNRQDAHEAETTALYEELDAVNAEVSEERKRNKALLAVLKNILANARAAITAAKGGRV